MHWSAWTIVSSEANLTSHLSISYSAAPTASGSPAAAGGTAAPGNAGPAGEGMAGFLAALVDQLLAGAEAGADATAVAGGDPAAAPETPVPFGTAIDPAALAVVQSTVPRGNILIKQLTQGLQALQKQLDEGETPDPDLLKRLGDLADAIAAMIDVPAPAAGAPAGTAATLDALAAIGKAGDTAKADPLGGQADTDAATPEPPQAVPDSVAQLLASLGLTAPSASTATPPEPDADGSVTPSVAATAEGKPLPAMAQLAEKLETLTRSIAAGAPEVAQKLDALARKLDAAEASPQALAQLTVAGDSDGADLDKIVEALLATRPAGPAAQPPALAAKAELPTPAPIVHSAPPQADAATPLSDIAASAPPSVATAKASSPPTATPTSDDAATPEAKVVAAAIASTDSNSADGSDSSSQQNTVPAAAPPAPPAAPRAIPAAYQAATSPINMGQVAFEMVRQVHQGTSRFSFRLDPPELGRVDVKLHVDASGAVNARLTVERSETLDMFQRDRGALEKALSQAGLDSGKTNLEFSLKQNQQNPFAGFAGGDHRPTGGNGGPQFSLSGSGIDGDDGMPAVPSITLYRGVASAGGVNLFV